LRHILPPSFLAEEWDSDVLSWERFVKIKGIVTDNFIQTGRANK